MKFRTAIVWAMAFCWIGDLRAAEIATTRDFTPMLGQGYISDRQALAGECLLGTAILEGKPEASISYESSMTEHQLAAELGVSAGGKARLGLVKAGASSSFFNASRSDGFSISAIYMGTYSFRNRIFKDPKLKKEYQSYVDDSNFKKWREACGDEYVVQQILGAKLFFSIRIDFLSEQEKKAFAANFSFESPFASASSSLSKAMSGLSKRTRVTINVLQVGGKVDKVTEIFHAKSGTPENEQGISKAYRFVRCTSGQFEECQSVLEQAIQYATDTRHGFPSQISPDLHTSNQDGGPAVLSSITQSYKTANIFLDITPELDRQMKTSRQLISEKYEEAFKQYTRVRRLVRDGVIRLSASQRDKFTKMESDLFKVLERIVESSLKCYQYPKQCGDAYDDLSEALPGGIKLYPENDFVVEPETFGQYCDLGQSPISEKPLSNTISAMIDAARELEPDAFKPSYEGAVVDVCNAAQTVFDRSTEVSFARKETDLLKRPFIEDLRPLSVLTNLKNLSLRGNALKGVADLGKLTGLEVLDLSRNQLTEVDRLSSLKNLKILDLSDNHIEDPSSLGTLSQLKRLDLRNNEREIRCPFQDEARCLIADFRTNNSFIYIDKLNSIAPRLGHSAVQLQDGRSLIVGGIFIGMNSAQRAEIYDPKIGRFHFTENLIEERYHHTATLLKDGNVLIVGGWGQSASASAEFFSMRDEAFHPVQAPNIPRARHSATLMNDGRVLLVGGWSNSLGFSRGKDATLTAEIYDPTSQSFAQVAPLSIPRASHRATLLQDGRVLVTGGHGSKGSSTTAEIYDSAKNEWQPVLSRMHRGRSNHTATLLKDGRVFITGGFNENIPVDRAEIFDPKTELFTEIADHMTEPRADHEALLLSDGKVVIIGGFNKFLREKDLDGDNTDGIISTAEIFDPISKLFSPLSKTMNAPRAIFTATQIKPNFILMVGGVGGQAAYSAELFEYAP